MSCVFFVRIAIWMEARQPIYRVAMTKRRIDRPRSVGGWMTLGVTSDQPGLRSLWAAPLRVVGARHDFRGGVGARVRRLRLGGLAVPGGAGTDPSRSAGDRSAGLPARRRWPAGCTSDSPPGLVTTRWWCCTSATPTTTRRCRRGGWSPRCRRAVGAFAALRPRGRRGRARAGYLAAVRRRPSPRMSRQPVGLEYRISGLTSRLRCSCSIMLRCGTRW
jgi:hypothetical protein